MVVKTQTCTFSHLKIYPGHGMYYVRSDSKPFWFLNAKCKHSFHHRWNPRKLAWTQLYRRAHKKGADQENGKKKQKRKAAKVVRTIAGLSIEELKKRKSQSTSQRKTMKDAAIRAAKDKKKALTKKNNVQGKARGKGGGGGKSHGGGGSRGGNAVQGRR